MGVLFVVYEGLSRARFFEGLQRYAEATSDFYVTLRDRIVESSETVVEVVGVFETSYRALREFIEPWRAVVYLGCGFFLLWFWRDVTQDAPESPTSSVGLSPASSADESPVSSPQDRAEYHLNASLMKALDQQALVLQKLVDRQHSILERQQESYDEERAACLLQAAKRDSGPTRNMGARSRSASPISRRS